MLIQAYQEQHYGYSPEFLAALQLYQNNPKQLEKSKTNSPYHAFFFLLANLDNKKVTSTDGAFSQALTIQASVPSVEAISSALKAYYLAREYQANKGERTRAKLDAIEQALSRATKTISDYNQSTHFLAGLVFHLSAMVKLDLIEAKDFDAQGSSTKLDAVWQDMDQASRYGFNYQKWCQARDSQTNGLIKDAKFSSSASINPDSKESVFAVKHSQLISDQMLDNSSILSVEYDPWPCHALAVCLFQRGFIAQGNNYLLHAANYGLDYAAISLNHGVWQQLTNRSWGMLLNELTNAVIKYKGKNKNGEDKAERQQLKRQLMQKLLAIQGIKNLEHRLTAVLREFLPLVNQVATVGAGRGQKLGNMAPGVKAQISQVARDCLQILEMHLQISSRSEFAGLDSACRGFVANEVKTPAGKLYPQAALVMSNYLFGYEQVVPSSELLPAVCVIDQLSGLQAYQYEQGLRVRKNNDNEVELTTDQVATAVADLEAKFLEFADHGFDFAAYYNKAEFREADAALTKNGALSNGQSYIDFTALPANVVAIAQPLTGPADIQRSKLYAHRALGRHYFANGLYAQAIKQFQKADQLGPANKDDSLQEQVLAQVGQAAGWPVIRQALLDNLLQYSRAAKKKEARGAIVDRAIEIIVEIDTQDITDEEKIRQLKHMSKTTDLMTFIEEHKDVKDVEAFKESLETAGFGLVELAVIANNLAGPGEKAQWTFSSAKVSDAIQYMLRPLVEYLHIQLDPEAAQRLAKSEHCVPLVENVFLKGKAKPVGYQVAVAQYQAQTNAGGTKSARFGLTALLRLQNFKLVDAEIDTGLRLQLQQSDLSTVGQPKRDSVSDLQAQLAKLDSTVTYIEQQLLGLADDSVDFVKYLNGKQAAAYVQKMISDKPLAPEEVIFTIEGLSSPDVQYGGTKNVIESKAALHYLLAFGFFNKGLFASGLKQLFKAQALNPAIIPADGPIKQLVNRSLANLFDRLLAASVHYRSSHADAEREKLAVNLAEIVDKYNQIVRADTQTDQDLIRAMFGDIFDLLVKMTNTSVTRAQSFQATVTRGKALPVLVHDVVKALVMVLDITGSALPKPKDMVSDSIFKEMAEYADRKHGQQFKPKAGSERDFSGHFLVRGARPFIMTAVGCATQTAVDANPWAKPVVAIEKFARASAENSVSRTVAGVLAAETAAQQLVAILTQRVANGFDIQGWFKQVEATAEKKPGHYPLPILESAGFLGSNTDVSPTQQDEIHYVVGKYLQSKNLSELSRAQFAQIKQKDAYTLPKEAVSVDIIGMAYAFDSYGSETKKFVDTLLSTKLFAALAAKKSGQLTIPTTVILPLAAELAQRFDPLIRQTIQFISQAEHTENPMRIGSRTLFLANQVALWFVSEREEPDNFVAFGINPDTGAINVQTFLQKVDANFSKAQQIVDGQQRDYEHFLKVQFRKLIVNGAKELAGLFDGFWKFFDDLFGESNGIEQLKLCYDKGPASKFNFDGFSQDLRQLMATMLPYRQLLQPLMKVLKAKAEAIETQQYDDPTAIVELVDLIIEIVGSEAFKGYQQWQLCFGFKPLKDYLNDNPGKYDGKVDIDPATQPVLAGLLRANNSVGGYFGLNFIEPIQKPLKVATIEGFGGPKPKQGGVLKDLLESCQQEGEVLRDQFVKLSACFDELETTCRRVNTDVLGKVPTQQLMDQLVREQKVVVHSDQPDHDPVQRLEGQATKTASDVKVLSMNVFEVFTRLQEVAVTHKPVVSPALKRVIADQPRDPFGQQATHSAVVGMATRGVGLHAPALPPTGTQGAKDKHENVFQQH